MIRLMRQALVFTFCAALAAFAAAVPAATAAERPRAVVELFTSQGCSSCPPADRLFSELAGRKDLVVLSYSVDYWDYLGWKDTLATPANSARQRGYAEVRGDRAVYTPQMVVNGARHLVGSDRRALTRGLAEADALPARVVLKRQGDLIEIHVTGDLPPAVRMATVYFLGVGGRVEVAIGRGENTGRRIAYSNVVRDIRAVGMWEGGRAVFRLPVSEVRKSGASNCAALVQVEIRGRPGPILGAGFL